MNISGFITDNDYTWGMATGHKKESTLWGPLRIEHYKNIQIPNSYCIIHGKMKVKDIEGLNLARYSDDDYDTIDTAHYGFNFHLYKRVFSCFVFITIRKWEERKDSEFVDVKLHCMYPYQMFMESAKNYAE